jgi:hypothetical protein
VVVVGRRPDERQVEVGWARGIVRDPIHVRACRRSGTLDRQESPEGDQGDDDRDRAQRVEDRRHGRPLHEERDGRQPRDHQGDVAGAEAAADERREPRVVVATG